MPGKGLLSVDAPGEYSGINVSKAKQKYSFPKGTRFPRIKGSYCETAAYEVAGDAYTKHGTSFGVGNRFKNGTNESPEPGKYDNKYDYTSKRRREPSYGFGSKRNDGVSKDIPGPGSYEPFTSFGQTGTKPGFGFRTKSLYDLGKGNPGPGSYDYNKGLGGR
jgi:hypothetical protein